MENENLLTVMAPANRVYLPKRSCLPKIKTTGGRQYYIIRRRCRIDDSHRPDSVRVFADTLGPEGLREVFDNVSNHCMACGALDYLPF